MGRQNCSGRDAHTGFKGEGPPLGFQGQSTKRAQTRATAARVEWKAAGLGSGDPHVYMLSSSQPPRLLLDQFPGNAPASPGLRRLSEVPDLIGLKN